MSGPRIRIGFHPLNDCALLAVAEETGAFVAEGLEVTLSREPSWSNVRDKLAYGLLEAAQMLAPMTLASTLGLGAGGGRLIAPMALGLNGNSVVLSTSLFEAIGGETSPSGAATALAELIRARRAGGDEPLVLAAPFTYSAQAYALKDWFASAGLDPLRELNLVIAPPSRLADMLADGVIDGFCAGAPWGQAAEVSGAGRIVFSDPDYWGLKPEKVLGVSPRWAAEEPDALRALMRALLKAAAWTDDPANRSDLYAVLSDPRYVGAPAETIRAAFEGPHAAGHVFARAAATFPWLSHAEWFAAQMIRWGQAPETTDVKSLARAVYRPDLWRTAAKDVGLSAPMRDSKIEGRHDRVWTLAAEPAPIEMPPDVFFHGRQFEPAAGD
ncbi:MAG: ABC transporter substrate-binding protein [Maricaulaceae bacterium]|jgi:NitT/TauT family transport system ATP-binding protein/nitrate/nitrite transport system substrate-binding protein